MITWLDFIAVVLAAGAIIDVWHKGSIFDTARAYAQALQDITPHDSIKGKLLELLNCPFCKSYHLPIYLFCFLWLGRNLGAFFADSAQIIVYGLAATRLGNILNGLLPSSLQYIPAIKSNDHGNAN
ncbi:hypothetical protein EBZ39_05480 [bacterium]|nr:hypothetical protein [bacterium]